MIAIGSDHGGYKLKEEIKKYFDECGIEYKDYGTYSEDRTDAPIFAKEVASSVQKNECSLGIVICKTGNGVAITANKFKGIRCAVCFNEAMAKQGKEHLNMNVLALPAELVSISSAVPMIRVWLGSEFLGGRYSERLEMIENIEKDNMK